MDHRELAQDLLRQARAHGADAADAVVAQGTEFHATVRKGEVETLTDAGSKALGLRVFVGRRTASSYTSDFSKTALERLVGDVVEMARATARTRRPGSPARWCPPRRSTSASSIPRWERPAPTRRSRWPAARRRRHSAPRPKSPTPRVLPSAPTRTRSCSPTRSASSGPTARPRSACRSCRWRARRGHGARLLVQRRPRPLRSAGARGGGPHRRRTDAAPSRSAQGGHGPGPGRLRPRNRSRPPGSRVRSDLGLRRLPERHVPEDRIGDRVASPLLTMVDDGRRPRGLGSRPFDGEGSPTGATSRSSAASSGTTCATGTPAQDRRAPDGQRAARRLRRAVGGRRQPLLRGGETPPEAIIGGVERGLYVTDLIGFGVDLVSGDYSQGAVGHWIEKGRLAFPSTRSRSRAISSSCCSTWTRWATTWSSAARRHRPRCASSA